MWFLPVETGKLFWMKIEAMHLPLVLKICFKIALKKTYNGTPLWKAIYLGKGFTAGWAPWPGLTTALVLPLEPIRTCGSQFRKLKLLKSHLAKQEWLISCQFGWQDLLASARGVNEEEELTAGQWKRSPALAAAESHTACWQQGSLCCAFKEKLIFSHFM